MSSTNSVRKILETIGSVSKKNWSGYEFFGFHRKDVQKVLKKSEKALEIFDELALKDVHNIVVRNAGPTSQLKSKQAMSNRNSKIDAVVKYASFGDIKVITI